MGLEILPKTIAFTPLNLSPICLTKPPFVQVFGWDLGPSKILFFKQLDVSHVFPAKLRCPLAGTSCNPMIRSLTSLVGMFEHTSCRAA